jgi:hypothetical protein
VSATLSETLPATRPSLDAAGARRYHPAIPEHPWPAALDPLFDGSITAEYSSLTASGRPVTVPTTPYVGAGGTLDVSTGLTYPTKAERARRNPSVSLLFADPLGERMADAPVALVQGHAAVRDSDLQANADRYVRASTTKLPDATKGQPKFVLKRMAWYYARIWVEITPLRIRWWSDRAMAEPAGEWLAPSGQALPASDPAPAGTAPPAWRPPPVDWRSVADRALDTLPLVDVTTVDGDGFPVCVPVGVVGIDGDTVELAVGAGAPVLPAGPGCLTVHGHAAHFTGQENHTLVGTLDTGGGSPRFRMERALADWSLVGNRASTAVSFLAAGRSLRPRLKAEAARRGQPLPKVRFG